MAISLINEQNLNLDEFSSGISALDIRIIQRGGHYFSYFPYGVSVAVVPLLLFTRTVAPDLLGADQFVFPELEIYFASVFVAAASVSLFFLARTFSVPLPVAIGSGLLFAFGTSAWSTASRALWQHGPSMFMLSLALLLLALARDRPALSQYAAIPLAFAYIIRPTNSIAIAVITGYVLFRHRRYLLRYLLWGGALALLFFWANFSAFGAILPDYFLPGRVGNSQRIGEALVGNLVSPARGLLIFTPIAGLILLSSLLRFRRLSGLEWASLAVIIGHWLLISTFPHWWGGWSFGPRFFTDVLPFFWLLLFPILTESTRFFHSAGYRGVFLLLAVFGGFVHLRGATAVETFASWNGLPVSVDEAPGRLWLWNDLQFLRGLAPAARFVAPDIHVQAPTLVTFRQFPDSDPADVKVLLINYAYQPLDWSFSAPPGVELHTQAQPDGAVVRLTAAIDLENADPARSDFPILATGVDRFGRSQTVEISLFLYSGPVERVFLPLLQAP